MIDPAPDFRHLRSWLFVPGDSERKIARCLEAGADAIIFDLEDSVMPEAKPGARATTLSVLRHARAAAPGIGLFVRINALSTGWAHADIEGTIAGAPDGYVIPKVTCAEDARDIAAMIDSACGATPGPALLPIATETPFAIFRQEEIATAHPRVAGVLWGMEDLAAEMGARASRDAAGRILPTFGIVRALALFAGTGANIAVLDTPVIDLGNDAVLAEEAAEASALGFTGKLAIHPSQIAAINAAFTPRPDEIENAREMLRLSQDGGGAAFRYKGRMVDTPHLRAARRLLGRLSPPG